MSTKTKEASPVKTKKRSRSGSKERNSMYWVAYFAGTTSCGPS